MLSKNYVEKRISENNNLILIETEKVPEKYGRYVTKVWLENPDKTLNDELVEKGLAAYVQY
jgi:endonuclease YncB( thermonuclease family)